MNYKEKQKEAKAKIKKKNIPDKLLWARKQANGGTDKSYNKK